MRLVEFLKSHYEEVQMATCKKYQNDVDIILSHRHDLGADYWTTQDLRLGKGGVFSALLEHWTIKRPISPCPYGIGKLFMQINLKIFSSAEHIKTKGVIINEPKKENCRYFHWRNYLNDCEQTYKRRNPFPIKRGYYVTGTPHQRFCRN